MGIYYPKVGISFMSGFPKIPGNVGIISQSGGNASEIIQLGASRGIHFSKLVSYGNALDLNEADLIEYLADDPDTDAMMREFLVFARWKAALMILLTVLVAGLEGEA